MSLSVMVFVISPSRSRTSPAADGWSRAVTGCTNSSTGSVHRTIRRSSPSWSPRTETAGPATITARRFVGTAKSSSCSPRRRIAGTTNSASPAPTGSSSRDGIDVAVPAFSTTSRPSARSPATTRRRLQRDLDSVVRAPEDERHRDEHGGRECRTEERELDPAEAPGERERGERPASTSQPAIETTPVTGAAPHRPTPVAARQPPTRSSERMPRARAPRIGTRCPLATGPRGDSVSAVMPRGRPAARRRRGCPRRCPRRRRRRTPTRGRR